MSTQDKWGVNNWRSCASGHVYLVGRSFSSVIVKIKMENCLSPAASRCGGPLEERRCPVEGCNCMIGGNAERLNTSNRLKLPTFQDLSHPQASEDVPSRGASGGDRPGQVRCHQLSAVGRFQLKVQRGAGEALWSHPGRRPCCRPPCSPAQRGCPGDISDVLLVFWQVDPSRS